MNSAKSRSFKGVAIVLGVFVGLFVIAGIAYAIDVSTNQGKIPRATSVGGVDISSLEREDALAKLDDELREAENEPVRVTAGEKTTEFVPAQAGLRLDLEGTIAAIPDESMNPFVRLASFFRSTKEVDVQTAEDPAALNPELDRMVGELHRDPEDGAVFLEAGNVEPRDAVPGQEVDRAQLQEEVTSSWLDPEGIAVEPSEIEPVINQDQVDAIAEGLAAKAVSGPLKVHGRENITGTIEPARVGEFVHFEAHEGQLEPRVDESKARDILGEGLAESERPMKNARLSMSGGQRQVTPHVDGEVIDWEQTMAGFAERVLGDDREWDATYEDQPATFTTADAEASTFDQVVGEFTTSGYSPASGTNISVISNALNGTIVSPGETFSVNQATGSRTAAQGYVESGVIYEGRADTAVGGGISQYATTLYNAAYFAAMEDVAHTPHSYYISRYPAGREATLYDGVIDLKFRNNSNHPVRIESSVGGGSVTVRLMGVKEYEVESISGGRWAHTNPPKQKVSGSNCIPTSGIPGFTTSDTRVIRTLGGAEVSRNTQTTVYDPQPIVTCG